MTLIHSMTARKNGAYTRLFGDIRRGHLVSQVHAASISAGTELEKCLGRSIPKDRLTTLPKLFDHKIHNLKKEIVLKPALERAGERRGIISDFAIFYHEKRHLLVIELKDGDTFDTQKAPAIKENLQRITDYLSQKTHYRADFFVCSFNAISKAEIVSGFKGSFIENQVMTGLELCYHLDVDYEDILKFRETHQKLNRQYFDAMTQVIRDGLKEEQYFDKVDEYKTGQLKLFSTRVSEDQ